ncbi:hypothetical protein [Actinotalea fermentans]|uniref:Uncharacterized protein n=1 Tax=Actinotalea fermentans TaxID=43671 RepID=A0A511Z113_9CELL|nr:hypothetical protein [Actinotalea fermentans]KGM16352.1 hypothetical protein N867_01125 [Actinotalea fermentans ATCC 43279 = JCM 9966 = DSM 3133]GEN81147.1 hypothetical protein AFE02nite_28810 [Actinotalea fermentans]
MSVQPGQLVGVEPYVASIGDIGVTRHWVMTPRGPAPLAGSEWWIADRGAWSQQIPVWAIILAIVFFPLGLLFLLCKETKWSGWLEVTVRSGALVHTAVLPLPSYEAQNAHAAVDRIRALAAEAGRA